MAETATKSDPKLWDKVKTKVTKGTKGGDAGQWSARKAQLATQEYKKAGGGYEGKKTADNSLANWSDAHNGSGTVAELRKRAAEKGIKGRSRMTKAELQHALS